MVISAIFFNVYVSIRLLKGIQEVNFCKYFLSTQINFLLFSKIAKIQITKTFHWTNDDFHNFPHF